MRGLREFWIHQVWRAGLRCFLTGQHIPLRHPLGGFVCTECSFKGRDLGEMGVMLKPSDAYIKSMRAQAVARSEGEEG